LGDALHFEEARDEIVRLREINRIAIRENAKLVAERDMLRDAVRKARLQVGVSYDSSGKVVAVSMGNMYPLAEILDAALKEDTPIS
jgi:hypothetical protein